MYLLSRPFVWVAKILKAIIKAPAKIAFSIRDRKARKNAKIAAGAVKRAGLN